MTSPHVNTFTRVDKNFEITLTIFRDLFSRNKKQSEATLAYIASTIHRAHATRKDQLQLLKLATFGEMHSTKGSLRWDNNLTAVTGVELDYDQEKISFDTARSLLIEAGICAIIYTSPSHTEDKPRWRVLAPLSEKVAPDKRHSLVARLNGVLGGVAAQESFSLSQSYYYGYIDGNDPPRVDVLDGVPINLRNDLDAGAIGKHGKNTGANGHDSARTYTEMEELIRRIVSGESLHPSVLSIAGKMAARGDHKETCIEVIGGAFEAAKANRYTDARWKGDVLRAIDYVWAKEEAKHTTPPPHGAEANPDWKSRLHITKKNAPMSNIHNALLTLQNAEEFAGLLAYDQMLCAPMICKSQPTELSANDITDIQIKLQISGMRGIGYETTKQAAVRHARNHSYHPIRNSFTQLAKEWDQQSRVPDWLIKYAGCEDTKYHRGIGEFFLRQIVKRIFEPGCKADYMLILEGPQGMQKSKIIRILAGEEKYYSDNLPELRDRKECSQHLRGLFLVEIGEMDTFSRAEVDTLKAFLSRQYERYRPPYEPAEVNEPRQCSFVGTANKETYLRDETGNRRYWVALCGKIDIPLLTADRNQIIGEAVTQYLNGEPTYPDPDWEQKNAHPEQDKRFEEDPWTDTIRKYIKGSDSASVTDILTSTGCLDIPKSQIDPFKGRRVASILRNLKWTSKRTETERYWVPPPRGDTKKP